MKPACWEACFLYPCPTVEHSNNCLLLLCVLFLKPSGHYTNLISKGIIATYDIPDRNGVSTNPDYINTGFHNVTKYSNGQCIYSIQAFIYTTSLVDCTIGNIPNDYMHIRQDVYSYCYDMTGNRFLLIRITPQGIVRLETLNGSTIPQSEVRMRGSIVF